MNFKTLLGQLRLLAILEGISYLLLGITGFGFSMKSAKLVNVGLYIIIKGKKDIIKHTYRWVCMK